MNQIKKIYWADKLGAISAFLCIIHCLTTPILLSIGINFLDNPVIAFIFIFLAYISIYNSTKKKLFNWLSIVLWLAFTGFVISIILEEKAEVFEYMMYAFSIIIIAGHLYNFRYWNK